MAIEKAAPIFRLIAHNVELFLQQLTSLYCKYINRMCGIVYNNLAMRLKDNVKRLK